MKFRKSGDSQKAFENLAFSDLEIFIPGIGDFPYLWIFIPGIGDFSDLDDFDPRFTKFLYHRFFINPVFFSVIFQI